MTSILKVVAGMAPVATGGRLLKGRTYYAKIQLTGLESAFGSASAVAGKLTEKGFAQVVVQKTPIDDVPDRAPFSGGSTYWARGVWTGEDTEIGRGSIPEQVKAVWLSDGHPAVDVATLPKPAPRAPAFSRAAGPGKAPAKLSELEPATAALGLAAAYILWRKRRPLARWLNRSTRRLGLGRLLR